ncbi:hypothetical protein QJQ45_018420 [Haematococcus lacustris]|nr:hypothetical protein QJQ45_018420 [Haematococcus lacustris]
MGPAAAAGAQVIDDLMPTDEDLLYEEELLRNPYALKMWCRYISARMGAPPKRRYLLYERALRSLPGSYKLWAAYLKERRTAVRGMRADHPAVEALNNTYERALVNMHKMPRIWLDYLELLVQQKLVTKARRTFDRALTALPITQHDRLWILYLKFIRQDGVPAETAVRVYRRYLKLEPEHAEEYITYLKAKDRWGEAARKLAEVLDDDSFRSLEGKSKHALWLELCEIITKHPRQVEGMRVDAILRGGIRKFTDEVGRLWTSLADYYIRRGMFEKARDVFEEGMSSVITVHDFSLVFDALTQFEESLLTAKMEQAGDAEPPEEPEEGDDGTDFLLKDDGDDLDLRLARLEHLMARRPELLSSVILRQNPHNVAEWHKRVKLFPNNPMKQILTYTEAVKTVDINKALGKPHTLWCAFAKFYERHGDVVNARVIWEKAITQPFKYADDLAAVWCEWAEMELRHQNFKRALELMRRATAEPADKPHRITHEEERRLPVQKRIYRNLKLFMFYADLEESLGTVESTKAVYDRIIELRIASPQIILNYAAFLQDHKFWEDSFQVYERGVALFKYPHVRDIWVAYLKHFVERYGGKKLERARDLFEHALGMAPAEEAKPLYLEAPCLPPYLSGYAPALLPAAPLPAQFALLEERHGLAKHAMEVYERAVKAVPKTQRLAILDLYLAKASEFFGIGKVREIYESAIEMEPPYDLADVDCRQMCMRYAELERKLGEIDRARAIFVHASSLANPGSAWEFWDAWKSFEVRHGNEDTFREMLRIKRSVAASYSHMQIQSVVDAARLSDSLTARAAQASAANLLGRDPMSALEAAAGAEEERSAAARAPSTALKGFVSAGVIQQGNTEQQRQLPAGLSGGKPSQGNNEEIELGGAEEGAQGRADASAATDGEQTGRDGEGEQGDEGPGGGEGEGDDVDLKQKAVPSGVYGTLAALAAKEGASEEAVGALERLKRRRVA